MVQLDCCHGVSESLQGLNESEPVSLDVKQNDIFSRQGRCLVSEGLFKALSPGETLLITLIWFVILVVMNADEVLLAGDPLAGCR